MISASPGSSSLRDRTRTAMREEVVAVAFRLFAARGFDGVTTTEIAREAGISPRSFFRYFPTKEDVVLGSLIESGELVRGALAARPPQETAWDALGNSLGILADHPNYPTQDLATLARLILETPSIRSRELENYQKWEELLIPGVIDRLTAFGEASPTLAEDHARVLIGAAMSCLRVSTQRWLKSGGAEDPVAILRRLLWAVRNC